MISMTARITTNTNTMTKAGICSILSTIVSTKMFPNINADVNMDLNLNNTISDSSSSSSRTLHGVSSSSSSSSSPSSPITIIVHRISEKVWRDAAQDHSNRIRNLLRPGLTSIDHPLNTGLQRQRKHQQDDDDDNNKINDWVTALDPKHPVYNFLIEYYGLKGTKGVRRLLKWSPGIKRIDCVGDDDTIADDIHYERGILLEGATLDDFGTILHSKGAFLWNNNNINCNNKDDDVDEYKYDDLCVEDRNSNRNSVVGDRDSDGGSLYLPSEFIYGRRRRRQNNTNTNTNTNTNNSNKSQNKKKITSALTSFLWYQSLLQRTMQATPVLHCYGLHEWAMQYQPILSSQQKQQNQLNAVQPINDNDVESDVIIDDGDATNIDTPSSKYQSHLKLRVDQQTLNETVETNTMFCTHIDAWKFFASDALKYNTFKINSSNNNNKNNSRGTPIATKTIINNDIVQADRRQQEEEQQKQQQQQQQKLDSEQPACVHTTMELLKIALKLGPFCDPELFYCVLKIALQARTLDVCASPYNVSKFCVPTGIFHHNESNNNDDDAINNVDDDNDSGNFSLLKAIKIETKQGRIEYKQNQTKLMKQAQPIRYELLKNYDQFLFLVKGREHRHEYNDKAKTDANARASITTTTY